MTVEATTVIVMPPVPNPAVVPLPEPAQSVVVMPENAPQKILIREGIQGPPGANGSKWWHGEGAPDDAMGADGDFYLETISGDIYYRTGGVWQ